MHMRWISLLGLAVSLCGCVGSHQQIKPPIAEHEYIDPPDEPQFRSPTQFPEKTLNNPIRRETTPMTPNAGGMRPGPGGAGGDAGIDTPHNFIRVYLRSSAANYKAMSRR